MTENPGCGYHGSHMLSLGDESIRESAKNRYTPVILFQITTCANRQTRSRKNHSHSHSTPTKKNSNQKGIPPPLRSRPPPSLIRKHRPTRPVLIRTSRYISTDTPKQGGDLGTTHGFRVLAASASIISADLSSSGFGFQCSTCPSAAGPRPEFSWKIASSRERPWLVRERPWLVRRSSRSSSSRRCSRSFFLARDFLTAALGGC